MVLQGPHLGRVERRSACEERRPGREQATHQVAWKSTTTSLSAGVEARTASNWRRSLISVTGMVLDGRDGSSGGLRRNDRRTRGLSADEMTASGLEFPRLTDSQRQRAGEGRRVCQSALLL